MKHYPFKIPNVISYLSVPGSRGGEVLTLYPGHMALGVDEC